MTKPKVSIFLLKTEKLSVFLQTLSTEMSHEFKYDLACNANFPFLICSKPLVHASGDTDKGKVALVIQTTILLLKKHCLMDKNLEIFHFKKFNSGFI